MLKKRVILWGVLAAVNGLFAQEELKISGGVMVGLGVSSDHTKAPTIYDGDGGWGDSDWTDGTWSKAAGQLEAKYTQENARVTLQLRGLFSNTNTYSLGIPLAKVEFDLLDKKIGLRAGRLNEYLWSPQACNWWQVTNGVGALMEIKPIEGLSFGGILKTDGVAGGVKSPEELFKRAAFGVSYTQSKLLFASAAVQLADGRDAEEAGGALRKAAFATLGLNCYVAPDLILNTEGKWSNIGGDGEITTNLVENIGYHIIPGTFKVGMYWFENVNMTDATISAEPYSQLAVLPYAEYVINPSFTAYIELEGRTNLVEDGKVTWYILPKLTYTLAKGAKLIGAYRLDIPASGTDPTHQVRCTFSAIF
jgi:hypothetical protein